MYERRLTVSAATYFVRGSFEAHPEELNIMVSCLDDSALII